MFKVNNKDTRTTPFEQVIADWVAVEENLRVIIIFYSFYKKHVFQLSHGIKNTYPSNLHQ